MRFVFLTDFKTIKAYDLKLLTSLDIEFEELSKTVIFLHFLELKSYYL